MLCTSSFSRMLAILIALPVLVQADVLVTFDNATDLDAFSGRTSGTVVGDYSWTDATGVGATPGAVSVDIVSTSQDAQNLFYTGQTYHGDTDPLAISVYFLAEAATTTATSRNFVGVATGTTTNLATGTNKMGVRVFKNGSTDWAFQLQNGTSTVNVGSNFALTDGHWYRMSVTITATDTANTYLLTGDLYDFGADGVSTPTLVRSDWAEFTNSNLGTAPSWVVGLLGQRSGGGAVAFDNLAISIIPEPGSLVLMAAGALCLFSRPRRAEVR